MSCVYCGGNHLYEYYPYSATSHFVRDDLARDQAYFDHSFCPSESFENKSLRIHMFIVLIKTPVLFTFIHMLQNKPLSIRKNLI